jgi:hypothetical protein
VSDGTSAQTETKLNYITVLPNPGVELPYFEGFEEGNFPDNYNFFVQNDDNDNTWAITDDASHSGDKSIKLLNYNMVGGTKDVFISGPIDLSGLDDSEEMLMTFKYAYNKRSEDNDEILKIYVSKDCGVTWTIRKNIHGDNLSEVTNQFSYTAGYEEDWTQVTLTNITSSYHVSNFRYKIEFKGDGGNNIFIDDINLYPESWLGNQELDVNNTVSIYPNPTSSFSTLEFFSISSEMTTIEVFNLVGEKAQVVHSGLVEKGMNQFELQTNELPTGVYFIRVKTESGIVTTKLIKE